MIAQHLLEVVLFLAIVASPLPTCLTLLMVTQREERRGFAHNWLVLLMGWCIVETGIGLLLGMMGQLHLTGVLVADGVVFFAGVLLFRRLQHHESSFALRSLWQLTQPLNPSEMLITGATGFIGFSLLWRIATRPITEWDSLWYHLPMMVNWYQTASFTMLEQFYDLKHADIHSTFPYNWEVLCTPFFMPFREDFLVTFPNLIAWALLGLAIYLLSRQCAATRIYGIAAASLMLALPIIIVHANAMQVDLPLAAFFLAGLYFALSYHRTRVLSYLALFLATLGLLCGTKTSAPLYGAVLVAALVGMEVKSFAQHGNFQRPVLKSPGVLSLCAIGAVCFLFLGGFWYVRNFVTMGNPLGYAKVKLAGVTFFPGPIDPAELQKKTTLASLFNTSNPRHRHILAEQFKEQLHFPFLMMGLCAAASPLGLATGRRRIPTESLVGFMALLLVTAWMYWSTPGSGHPAPGYTDLYTSQYVGQQFRYGFVFMGVLAILAAVGASTIRASDKVMVAIVLVSSVLGMYRISQSTRAFYASVALLLVWEWFCVTYAMRWATSKPQRARRWKWMVAVPLLTVFCVSASFAARKKRDAQRDQVKVYGGVLKFISEQTSKDEIIGYLPGYRNYLFYGKNLDRKRAYVPAPSDDLSTWVQLLRQQKVSVIATYPSLDIDRVRREFNWLEDASGPFVRVFGDPQVEQPLLYRFKNDSL